MVQTFLQTINKEIEQNRKPVQTELTTVQEALTILADIEAHTKEQSIHYPQLLAMQTYVQTLRDQKGE